MVLFPFGLDKEADIYYMSALNALRIDPQVPVVTQDMAANMRSSGLQHMSLHEVISLIVRWTKESIQEQGTYDENSVAWMIALYVKSYELACSPNSIPFKEVYTTCFKKYYGG